MRRRSIALAGAGLLAAGLALLWQGLWIPAKAALAQILLDRAFAASAAAAGAPVRAWDWADTWPVARLAVPRLGVDLVVLAGASGEALAFGPALLDGGAVPGEAGTSVVAGHRDTHFAFLGGLVPGDRIEVMRADGRVAAFVVRATRVAAWDRPGIDAHADGSWLVLTTCWPLDARLPGPQRYLVVAEAVDGAGA
ncbi:MAG: class GN sortase [Alphaproteobacteria bacterium]